MGIHLAIALVNLAVSALLTYLPWLQSAREVCRAHLDPVFVQAC